MSLIPYCYTKMYPPEFYRGKINRWFDMMREEDEAYWPVYSIRSIGGTTSVTFMLTKVLPVTEETGARILVRARGKRTAVKIVRDWEEYLVGAVIVSSKWRHQGVLSPTENTFNPSSRPFPKVNFAMLTDSKSFADFIDVVQRDLGERWFH